MKKLLAHFRRKSPEPAAAPVKAPEPAPLKAEPIVPARLHTTVARAVKPAWHAPGATFPAKARASAAAEPALATEIVTLRLGDFIERIPAELLDAGAPDRTIPMPFDLSSLSERIGRGETTIRLAEIYRRMPDIFRSDAAIGTERVISFPWTKVLAMIQEAKAGTTDGGISPSGVEALVSKFKARKLRVPSKMAPTPRAAGTAAASVATDEEKLPAVRAAAPLALVQPPEAVPACAEELAQLRAERDAAVVRAAEFGAEYDASIGRTGELTAERDAAVARVAELTASHEADTARTTALTAERDAAVARAAELAAECAAALARGAEPATEDPALPARLAALAAERDAATARAEKLFADSEAALALGMELSAERDRATARAAGLTGELEAAQARLTALTAERDADAARAEKSAAERTAAAALHTELRTERDAAGAQLAALTSERAAALSRLAEVTAERDAATARTAELLQAAEKSVPAPLTPPAVSDSSAGLEGYKNSIEALLEERTQLRREIEKLTGKSMAPRIPAPAQAAVAHDPLPDAYSDLFPEQMRYRRIAAFVGLAILVAGAVTQWPSGSILPKDAAAPAGLPPTIEQELSTPALSEAALPVNSFTLEPDSPPATVTRLPEEPVADAAD